MDKNNEDELKAFGRHLLKDAMFCVNGKNFFLKLTPKEIDSIVNEKFNTFQHDSSGEDCTVR